MNILEILMSIDCIILIILWIKIERFRKFISWTCL